MKDVINARIVKTIMRKKEGALKKNFAEMKKYALLHVECTFYE